MYKRRRSSVKGRGRVPGMRSAVRVLLLAFPIAQACAPAVATSSDPARSDPGAVRAHLLATLGQADGAHRWPAGTVLRVDATRLDPVDRRAVFRAFDAWLRESRAKLAVRPADGVRTANVVVRPPEGPPPRHRGRTVLDWEGDRVVRATVEVVLERGGTLVSGLERDRILVHEIGHVLGLAHSPRLGSIMHPEAPGVGVDATDRATLAELYAAGVGRTTIASLATAVTDDPEAAAGPDESTAPASPGTRR